MPGDCGPYAVVPGVSSAGHTAEPGGAHPGPGAGLSFESGGSPLLGGLPVSPPPRGAGGPGAGRRPPEPGDRPGVFALGRVWDLLAGLGTDHAGPERGGPDAGPPGSGGCPGHGTDTVAGLSGPARPGSWACGPGGGGIA